MEQRKKYVTAAVTLAVTGALAHVMQSSQPSAPPKDTGLNSAAIFSVPSAAPETARRMAKPLVAPVPDAPAADNLALAIPVALSADGSGIPDASEPPIPSRAEAVGPPADAGPADMAPDTELAMVLPHEMPGEADTPDTVLGLAATTPDIPVDVASPDPMTVPGPSPHDRLADNLQPVVETPATPRVSEFGLACGAIVTAVVRPSAMTRLTVTAPCRGGEVIAIRQGALSYDTELDSLGLHSTLIPALTRSAEIEVTFADGETVIESVSVADADRVDRVIVQYDAAAGLEIHALEFGADYGDEGHVWAGNPRDPDAAARVNGGFVTRLGGAGHIAEVYTLPSDTEGRDGVVRLSIEAEVTEANCGRDIAGQLIQRDSDGRMQPVALTLSMPDCDALGEFLVLKNLAWDLRIAANE